MSLFMQALVAGLLLGGVYALIAVGLNLIFGVVKIINFAHGEFVMMAMYATFWMWSAWNLSPYLSIFIITPLMFVFGMVLQRFILQPMQNSSPTMKIFVTLGLSILLQNLALVLFGGQFRSTQFPWGEKSVTVLGISATYGRITAFVVALVLVAALFYIMKKTLIGKVLRALAEDRETAGLIGIPVKKYYLVAMGLGTAMTAIAGVLIAPFHSVFPLAGAHFTLLAFVVVVLGGLGNMVGSLVGGLLLGAVETLVGTYIDPALQLVAVFVVFIIVLLARPQGIFGGSASNAEVGLK
ncbi:branched-chain amino acid ABC transporter permease [Pseudarthrobacter sp. RMG13]|uniref:Branched-chain amino acid ABC transporter permease n=1 Tax=Pseudarthrobacter humi TaxID=2952523 RepID=A0ABT1LWP5_9MICC|nr:branched-chain amino acid ABC transporter permease [Pseudarthrobacter humi]MCP9002053.1 branched-chain amino acid ABC transporter permease [Pseudarthrobacter humi]